MKRFWILVICLSFILTLGFYDRADASSIIADTEVGFKNTYKLGKWTPISVTINNTGDNIEGSLEVAVGAGHDESAIYSVPMNIPASSVKEYTIYAKIQNHMQEVDIKLIDKNDKLIEESTIKRLTPILDDSYMLGILSEQESSLGYWMDGTANSPILSNYQPISLSSDSLPDRVETMGNFDIIVLNNFDTSSLSEKQITALDSWLKGGGILIIGTGPNARRTLSGLSPAIIPVTVGDTINLDSAYVLQALASSPMAEGPLNIADLKSDSGLVIAQQDDIPLITMHHVGKGFVYTSAFDLGIEPILGWRGNKMLWENTLEATLTHQRAMDLKSQGKSVNSDNFDRILGNISAMELPSAATILFVFLLYLGMVGPLNYIILKKFDKREWSWLTIPLLSVIFAGIIYGFGFSTKGNEIVMNTISIVDLQDGSDKGELTEHIGVFFPSRGDYTIDIGSNSLISVGQDTDQRYYHQSDAGRVSTRIVQGGASRIEFDDVNVWMMKTFTIDNRIINIGTIDAELTYKDDKITGRLINNTDYPLEDFVLYLGNGYQKLGNIASGESKNVSFQLSADNINDPASGMLYRIVEDVYPWNSAPPGGDREFDIRREIFWSQIADREYSGHLSVTQLKAEFFAFYADGTEYQVEINGMEPSRSEGRGLITGRLDINWENGRDIWDSLSLEEVDRWRDRDRVSSSMRFGIDTNEDGLIIIPAEFVSTTLEEQMSKDAHQDGNLTVFHNSDSYAVYSIDLTPYLELEDMIAIIVAENHGGSTKLYNQSEGHFVENNRDFVEINEENMDEYIDVNNKVYIRVEPFIYDDEYLGLTPPSISIEGRIH